MNQAVLPPTRYSGEEDRADFDLPAGQACLRVRASPRRRRPNEDAAIIIPIGEAGVVLAVADGVGGAPGGRQAANLVLEAVAREIRAGDESRAAVRSAIRRALERCNARLLAGGLGSATTIAAVEIVGCALNSYHVGDSEILVVGQRGKKRHRIVPHSPTGLAVRAGLLTDDDALHHDFRHILLNVVGAPQMRLEIEGIIELRMRDTVLVATDGVFDNLYLDEIIEIIRCGSLSAAADELAEKSVARMRNADPRLPSKPDDLALVLFRPAVKGRSAPAG
jgi:PPM family protein phosphatase